MNLNSLSANPNAIWYSINTIRIYSPIKNSEDHDPEGIKNGYQSWLIPVNLIHEPWKLNPIEQQFIIAK
jgi:deoxyribodipyrimidine photo-lyase